MDHYKPHPGATFEGFYNKFELPSGARIVLIISRVPETGKRANYVSFTYIPASPNDDRVSQHGKVYQREFWPETLKYTEHSSRDGFVLTTTDGLAEFNIHGSKGTYALKSTDGLAFHASFSTTTPWSTSATTPESWLVNLPLPLHWHVQSLATPVEFQLDLPRDDDNAASIVSPDDRRGRAIVHQEKNWATSFPASHMWMQARRHADDSNAGDAAGLCLAGGQVLGMEAFLVGYRNARAGVEFDFRPPFALRLPVPFTGGLLGLGPFMSFRKDWDARTFEMSVASLTEKLEVEASAPKGSFYALSAPFDDGHRPNFLAQSMKARIRVRAFRRRWWVVGAWEVVCEDVFEGGALEFGGEYYPPRGSNKIAH